MELMYVDLDVHFSGTQKSNKIISIGDIDNNLKSFRLVTENKF